MSKTLSLSDKFLNYDYVSLYNYTKFSKYFLPAMMSKLYLSALIMVFAQTQVFYCVSILGCI